MSIELKNVTYTYSPGTAYESHALKDVSLVIPDGQFIGIIGHTGSGKSTLIQHLNALVQPTSGQILYNGEDVWAEKYDRKQLRSEVGLVFQYPEHQLFENDVLSDVCFGPMNQGLSREEAAKEAKQALTQVGVKESNFKKSPFELSGGQKKRVAIAGVLAMNPKILILDEPTAGLDPNERIRFRSLLSELSQNRLVLLSTHIVSDIEYIADSVFLMKEGEITKTGTVEELTSCLPAGVWECTVNGREAEFFVKNYKISNIRRSEGKTKIRVLSEEKPREDAALVTANLEDVFLYYFGRRAGEEDGEI